MNAGLIGTTQSRVDQVFVSVDSVPTPRRSIYKLFRDASERGRHELNDSFLRPNRLENGHEAGIFIDRQ